MAEVNTVMDMPSGEPGAARACLLESGSECEQTAAPESALEAAQARVRAASAALAVAIARPARAPGYAAAVLSERLVGARAALDCARRSAPCSPDAAEFWRAAVVAGDAAAAAAVVAGASGGIVRGAAVVRELGRVVARWEWRLGRLTAAARDESAAADLARRARLRFRRGVGAVFAAAAESDEWPEALQRAAPALRAAAADLDDLGWPADD